jgi:hypothetical protein
MAVDFNPYHVWLGIPPDEQPANYYRLLGIRPFEANGDVIDSAADRQMAHLRTIQTGKHGELTQRLLNEVAAARVCLLDPKKRAAYDQQLRSKLAASLPQAAATPQPADVWDNLLGDPSGKRAAKASAKSGKAATKRDSTNRMVAYSVAAAVVVAAAIGIGIFASGGSSQPTGTLVFDLPAADRSETTIAVDSSPITLPSDGRWDCPPGTHHIVGQRPAYKFSADVTVVAGQDEKISPEWRPKAVLVLDLQPELRSGAELKIDGHLHAVTQHVPLEIAVDPGRHFVQVTRPGSDTIATMVTVAPGGREVVAIKPPPTTATLVFDWPADERKDAELTVDGHSQQISSGSDTNSLELTVPPGKHVVRMSRAGFESFRQSVELSAGANQAIKPTWTPEQKAPAVVETAPPAETKRPAETAPQPVKKIAPPSSAEIERIAKQIDGLYKTSGAGAKNPAKAQELYAVASKDGSSPAERYVLLMRGAEIAAAGGDLNLALSGIDTLDGGYEIDALELKQELLDRFLLVAKPDQVASAIPLAEQLVDQAMAGDRYEIALAVATAASGAADKLQMPARKEIEDRLSRRTREIRIIGPAYAAVKAAHQTLAKNPADPEANLAVGRWRCFYKSDWSTGLRLLAKGSDEKLKSLAVAELKSPTDAERQIALADGWWSLAEKESGVARDSLRRHAGGIYQVALPGLASALKKAEVGVRLKEIAVLGTVHTPASGDTTAGEFHYTVNEHSWKRGQPIVRLMQKNRGFCFLASVSGHFAGYGEAARVCVTKEGFWSLDARSGQDALSATAISIENLTPKIFKSKLTEFQWRNGDPPVKMLHENNGICFLSAIGGWLEGPGERVSVRLADDGYWYLDGKSGQKELGANAIGIEWANPGEYSIETKEHNCSAGDPPVALLKKGEGLAFLSSVSGQFHGYGDEVRVYLGNDETWYLARKSREKSVRATATSIRVLNVAARRATAQP